MGYWRDGPGYTIDPPTMNERKELRDRCERILTLGASTRSAHIPVDGSPGCGDRAARDPEEYMSKPVASFPTGSISWCKWCLEAWRDGEIEPEELATDGGTAIDVHEHEQDPALASSPDEHDRAHPDHPPVDVVPFGEPKGRPVAIKCGLPSCEGEITTYLTDEAVENGTTLQLKAFTPKAAGWRLVTRHYCGEECLNAHLDHLHARSALGSIAGEADSARIPYLGFAEAFVEPIIDGDKTATIRLGLDRDLRRWDTAELRTPDGDVFALAVIRAIRTRSAASIVDHPPDGHREYESTEELHAELAGYYPEEITTVEALRDRELTEIEFEVIR